ncbi:MAG TPA: hypothetical protein PLX18_05640 [Anaerohalosphaeraceae bacterium]|nr:hypothetical protein [Anaerohalosphaeraceae bacterium]HQG05620.1 hypothetical protein [Anaerohalosphaeraceae bacterium]HQI07324.1 hypothetical protein [Anaerohalosphaeraceae bacterium]HQJ67568.1 hypothetical protein [Anaerohalosphaeraceae bacterium]
MNAIKWIRKNERKLMAWLVILIMISFVGGYGLQQFLMYIGQGGAKQVIAAYGDGQKIRAGEVQAAQNELEILKMLMADRMLSAFSQMYGDLSPQLLELILFPDTRASGELRLQLMALVERGQLNLKPEEIDSFFAPHEHRPEILWILLKKEVEKVGYVVPDADAAGYLRQIISGLTQNQVDPSMLLSQVVQRTKKSEQEIIRIFGNLVSVMNYADLVLGNYLVTTDEIRSQIARTMEKLTAEALFLDAEEWVDEQPEPTEEEIQKQFQQYRSVYPMSFSPDNPYGFGYALGKRIQLEYLLVRLDDIQKRVEKPSFDELESYYLRNISKFQQSEPIDPNNPEAGTRTITRPFAQVMQQVRQEVEKQRAEALANNILNEARQMIDAGWDTLDLEKAAVAQMQQAAGDYTTAARELEKKYQISVVTGKTGWLRPEDLSSEPFLRRVVLTAPSSVRLIDVLLAIPETGKPSSQPGLPPVRVWETISPISGGMPADGQYITLRGMVRVIGIQPPLVPEDVNFSFDNHGVSLSQPPQPSVFSVREQVIKDLKTLRAMEKARTQAADLVRFVEADGWEKGLQRFYETYYPQTDPNSPSPLRPQLRTLPEQTVPPQSQVEMLRQRLAVPSASRDILVSRYQNAVFIRKLAEILDPSQETTGPIAHLLVFEPARNVVVVKQLTRKPATEKDYADNKSKVAMQRAMLAKIDLGLVHFNPKNIAGRMGLVYKKTKEPPQLMPVDVDLPVD